VDVGRDGALGGDARPLLVCLGEALLAERRGSLLEVVVGVHERLLGVHHAGAGHVAKLLDELGGHLDGGLLLLLSLGLLRCGRRGFSLGLLRLGLRCHLSGEVLRLLLDPFAEVEPHEAAHADLLPNLRDRLLHERAHRLIGVLDVRLLEQRHLLDALRHAPLNHLLTNILRLRREVFLAHLNLLLLREELRVDVVDAHALNVRARRDLHGDVLRELLELVAAGDKVRLAVELEEHADAGAGVDVGRDGALGGDARPLLVCLGEALLAERRGSLLEVVVGVHERLLGVHHAGAGHVAKLLDELGGHRRLSGRLGLGLSCGDRLGLWLWLRLGLRLSLGDDRLGLSLGDRLGLWLGLSLGDRLGLGSGLLLDDGRRDGSL